MNVQTHNEAGRCRHKDCRSSRLVARQLCRAHYNWHWKRDTLKHFPAKQPWRNGDPHICDHAPSVNCYKNHSCRCDDCRDADRKRQAKVKARHMRGLAPTIEVTHVREHLATQVSRHGVTLRQCADMTGISYHVLRSISCGSTKKLSPVNFNLLMNWEGVGWCETCGNGVRAYGPGRWCLDCLNYQRRQHAASTHNRTCHDRQSVTVPGQPA